MSKLPKINKKIKGFGSYLPAKIPKKSKQLGIDLTKIKKNKNSERFLKNLAEEKRTIRKEKAKKIAWKKIDEHEYEVILKGTGSDLSIGNVKRGIKNKWSMHPSFEPGSKSFRYNLAVKKEFYDWHKAGHAMIELWIVT